MPAVETSLSAGYCSQQLMLEWEGEVGWDLGAMGGQQVPSLF